VRCWGNNYYGQSKVPADLGHVTAFASGDHHTCAIARGRVRLGWAMAPRLTHTQLLRYAGLLTWAVVGIPLVLNSWYFPAGNGSDALAPTPDLKGAMFAYLAFGVAYWQVTRDLGVRRPRWFDYLLLGVLSVSAVATSQLSGTGLGGILLMIVAGVIPWLVPLTLGIIWMVAQHMALVPVFIEGQGFPMLEAVLQAALYIGYSGFPCINGLVAQQRAQGRDTGICGGLGKCVARVLHREDRVIGIDRRPFAGKPKDIVHHQFDLRRKKTRDVFRAGGIRAVVHLGIMHDLRASPKEHHTWNVVGFQKVLEYMTQYGVPKLVVLSSANVYGPSPENPQFLTEDAPLLGAQAFSEIRDLVEVDHLAQSFFWKNPQVETVILRPCHILGSVRNAPSNYLRYERPLRVMGFDPMVQVIHERDVAQAVRLSLRRGVRGIFNLRGPGEVPLSHVFRILGRKPLAVPGGLLEAGLTRAFRYRMTSFPGPELDHIRYVCMVDDTRARRELGFTPRFGIEDTVRAVLDVA